MSQSDSVVVAMLKHLKSYGKMANIIRTDGHFFNGLILSIDDTHVEIADRVDGRVVLLLDDVSQVRESRVGGREHD